MTSAAPLIDHVLFARCKQPPIFSCSRWGSFKLEISFEWGTTRISIRTFIILNTYIYIYIYISDLNDNITTNVLKFAEDTSV